MSEPSDDGQREEEQGDAHAAGWLGAVRSWIGTAAPPAGTGHSLAAGSHLTAHHTMTPAEVRERRLQHQQASFGAAAVNAPAVAQLQSMDVDDPPPSPLAVPVSSFSSSPSGGVSASNKPARPPPTPISEQGTRKPSSPASSEGTAVTRTSQQKTERSLASKTAGTADSRAGCGGSGNAVSTRQITMEQRRSAVLKRAFRVTLNATEASTYTFLSAFAGEGDGEVLLGTDNLPEVVLARLLMDNPLTAAVQGGGGAPSSGGSSETGLLYLAASFVRLNEEGQTLSRKVERSAANAQERNSTAETLAAIEEARTLVVNFAASCLSEPGAFGPATEDSHGQLARALLANPGSVPASFLGAVAGEAKSAGSLEEAFSPILKHLQERIQTCTAVGDDWMAPLVALSALCGIRSLAELYVMQDGFLLPAADSPAAAPVPAPTTMPFMFPGMQMPMVSPRSGPMVETNTPLGQIIRIGLPVTHPSVQEAFAGVQAMRRSRLGIDSKIKVFQSQLTSVHTASTDFVNLLLKASLGKEGNVEVRHRIVRWFSDAVVLNVTAEASRPDPRKTATDAFLCGLGVVLLRLSMPFVRDAAKFAKVDSLTLLLSKHAREAIFPADTTALAAKPQPSGDAAAVLSAGASSGDGTALEDLKSFTTQLFFLCWRALHLGVMQLCQRHTRLNQEIGHFQRQARGGNAQAEDHLEMLWAIRFGTEATILHPEIVSDVAQFLIVSADWLTRFVSDVANVPLDSSEDDTTPASTLAVEAAAAGVATTEALWVLPEHFLDDPLEFFIFISRYSPHALAVVQLDALMTLSVFFLAHPSLVRSPHLRAKLGDLLFDIFLPIDERPDPQQFRGPGIPLFPEAHMHLLYSHPLAQKHLAPALLLLYGDVEHTGFYDKLDHRYHICAVLKCLWKSNEHRKTFRRISQDTDKFVRFANGLMNETNNLVASTMEKLPQIRATQLQQKDTVAWAALGDEARQQALDRLSSHEREVTSYMLLCNETIHMVNYLTSDPEIQKPFMLPELLPRLASMACSVLAQLVGKKGLEIKVDDPDALNFKPKEMLREMCEIFVNFASHALFHEAVATSAYYEQSQEMLVQAVATCRRMNLLEPATLQRLEALAVDVRAARDAATAEDDIEVPEEFLDELMQTLMTDPVLLPSGHVVDRSTANQIILNKAVDPFNREPLTKEGLTTADELKEKIELWREQLRKKRQRTHVASD